MGVQGEVTIEELRRGAEKADEDGESGAMAWGVAYSVLGTRYSVLIQCGQPSGLISVSRMIGALRSPAKMLDSSGWVR